MIFSTFNTATSLQWNIESEYIVFGKDVLLNCDGNVCSSKSIKKWIGGPQYDLLCYDDTSTNPSKYEMIIKDNIPNFVLKIRNLTIDDVNCKYTCTCGLHQYTKLLDLNDIQYVYPPHIDTYFNNQTEYNYTVDIVIEVHPLPTCFLVYEMTVIPVNVTSFPSMRSMFNESSSRMHKLRIHHTLQKTEFKFCGGILHVLCEVGSVNYTVLNENMTMCKDSNDSKETKVKKGLVIMVVTGITLLVIVIVVLLMQRCIMRCTMRRTTTFYNRRHGCNGTKQGQRKLQPLKPLLLTEDK